MIRLLLILLFSQCGGLFAQAEFPAPRQVDERRAAQVGIRKIVGKHLWLYTDLPASDAVDSLPVVFDAAVPLWADYFRIAPAKVRDWRMQGFLIQDRAKFAALGLLPKENPIFTNGFSIGSELWWMEQSSDYFRRHLLLHEGTHGFMAVFLEGRGQLGDSWPGWYLEGMAELLGTHRWQDGQLRLHVMPASRGEVPMWGRIKFVRDSHRADKPMAVPAIMALDRRRAFSTDEYAWCWALCEFLDSHPRWQKKFRELPQQVDRRQFNKRFRHEFRQEWPDLLVEWQTFVSTLDYGYDSKRMVMRHRRPSEPVSAPAETTLAADQGWQSTGWQLKAEQKYELQAAGRYQIAEDGGPWPCEPGGVTLRYHEGRPLGMLLGAWRETASHRFSTPFAVGLTRTLQPPADAVLYLRVNDSSAGLSDNRGRLRASIRQAGD